MVKKQPTIFVLNGSIQRENGSGVFFVSVFLRSVPSFVNLF